MWVWLRSCGLLLATMLTTFLAALPALACSCALLTTQEYVDNADVVARVTVERIELPQGGTVSSNDATTYRVQPTHLWKGDVAGVFTVFSAVSGASCGLEGITEGSDIVLFAYEASDGILPDDLEGLQTDLCSGTAPADAALVAEVTDVLGDGKPVDAASEDEGAPDADSDELGGDAVGVWWALGAGGVVLLAGALWLVVRTRGP